MAGTFVMRELRPEDAPQLAELYRQFWEQPDSHDIDRMRAKITELAGNPHYVLLAATAGERLLGTVIGIVCENVYGDCRPFLVAEDFIVDRKRRRTGVGKALLAELERRARARDCRYLILVTETDRADACAFYAAMGFDPEANRGSRKSFNRPLPNRETRYRLFPRLTISRRSTTLSSRTRYR